MAQIKHIVYLMLENRSLDNVLGWLYEGDRPANVIPHDSSPDFDGLNDDLYNKDAKGNKHPVVKVPQDRYMVPSVDPHEEYEHVNNQLFETLATPVSPTPPSMGGFYKDFAAWYKNTGQIMECFTPQDLPVLNGLARHFAVSDRYFSSVPTQTNCNRAFAAAGNSLGNNDDGHLQAWVNNRNSGLLQFGQPRGTQFNGKTIWNVLSDNGHGDPSDWMIFNSCGSWLANRLGAEGYQYTRKIMEQLQDQKFDDHFATMGDPGSTAADTFFGMVANGTLPTFSFLEPQWGLGSISRLGFTGNDYHPPKNVRQGEEFLKSIYDALTANNEIWDGLLFIINFDEHGGTYDHVPPPWNAAPPWADGETPRPEFLEGGFEFDRFGVRVPLILVSPWVAESTVFRAEGDTPGDDPSSPPYDHASVIATVLNLMGVDKSRWGLGARVADAPSFDNVLTDHLRTDVPTLGTNPAW